MRLLPVLIAGTALVVAACSGGPPATAAPGSEPPPAARILEAGPISLEVPATWEGRPWTWHVTRGAPIPSGDFPIAFLSPQPFVDACRWEGEAIACGAWPIARLVDGGIVVAVRTYGGPGRVLPVGEPTTVDGREARVVRAPGDAACAAIGGTERVRTIVPGEPGPPERAGSFSSWTEIDACLGGTSAAATDALAAIVSSICWLAEE